jgi:thioredoxin reductase (NADPH)
MQKSWDCLVVGGGPAGLTAATYLSRFRRTVLVADSGASRAALIPRSHNYPGFPGGISGRDLLKEQRRQAASAGATLIRGAVSSLQHRDEETFVANVGGEIITAARVVLASGLVDDKPQFASGFQLIDRAAIRFCPICDAPEALDQRIGVLGPPNHAWRKAVFLRTYSREVILLPFGSAEMDEDARHALSTVGVEVLHEPVVDLEDLGNAVRVSAETGAHRTVDVLYVAMGANIRSELAIRLGAEANPAGCLVVDGKQRTSVPGLYAAGDVTNELHQISVATGQAAIAATNIHHSLAPNPR